MTDTNTQQATETTEKQSTRKGNPYIRSITRQDFEAMDSNTWLFQKLDSVFKQTELTPTEFNKLAKAYAAWMKDEQARAKAAAMAELKKLMESSGLSVADLQ